jgi:DNA-binding NarL/FixJ family response regulator
VAEPTPRQLWVLIVYIETGSYSAAARRLNVSPETVRNHLTECRTAFHARNTAQAFAAAVRAGLIDPERMHLDVVA